MGYGFTVRIARLPDGKDPNDASAEEVRSAIFKATLLSRMSAIKLLCEASSMVA